MDQTTKSRAAIAMMAFMVVNALLFAAGIVIAMMAAFSGATPWIAAAVIAGLILIMPRAHDAMKRSRAHERPVTASEPVTLRVQYRGYHRAG